MKIGSVPTKNTGNAILVEMIDIGWDLDKFEAYIEAYDPDKEIKPQQETIKCEHCHEKTPLTAWLEEKINAKIDMANEERRKSGKASDLEAQASAFIEVRDHITKDNEIIVNLNQLVKSKAKEYLAKLSQSDEFIEAIKEKIIPKGYHDVEEFYPDNDDLKDDSDLDKDPDFAKCKNCGKDIYRTINYKWRHSDNYKKGCSTNTKAEPKE